MADNKNLETATFGNDCFWCTEAMFQQLEGGGKVKSGSSGGYVENGTYEQVCDKEIGHAEVINMDYDHSKISFGKLLEVCRATHDPTTMNRQGNDTWPLYRSVIFYDNTEQKDKAERYKKDLDKRGAFDKPVGIAIEPFTKYFPAENCHRDYYKNHGSQPYCYFVIKPKMDKIKKAVADILKP